jgi:hypothetical protein
MVPVLTCIREVPDTSLSRYNATPLTLEECLRAIIRMSPTSSSHILSHSVFTTHSSIGLLTNPLAVDIRHSKISTSLVGVLNIWALEMSPKTNMTLSLITALNEFDLNSVIFGDHGPK